MFKIITKDQAAEELAKSETYSINIPEKDLENKYKTGLNNSYSFENSAEVIVALPVLIPEPR